MALNIPRMRALDFPVSPCNGFLGFNTWTLARGVRRGGPSRILPVAGGGILARPGAFSKRKTQPIARYFGVKNPIPVRQILSKLPAMALASLLALTLVRCAPMERTDSQVDSAAVAARPTPTPQPITIQGGNPAIDAGDLTLRPVDNLTQLPSGTCISGRWDDILLANNQLWCVFGNPTPFQGDEIRPGALLDLARKPTNRDSLWVFVPNHGDRKAKMRTLSVEPRAEGYPNQGAAVVVKQESRELKGLTAVTEYILEPNSDFLQIVTTWENQTTQTLPNLALGDLMEWGAGNGFLPGKGPIPPGKPFEAQSEYLAFLQSHDTFVVGPKSGNVKVEALQTSVAATYDTVSLTVGGRVSIERRLYAGGEDVSLLGAKVYDYASIPYGWIAGRLTEVAKNEKDQLMDLGPVAKGEIQVIAGKRGGKLVDVLPFTRAFTNDAGEFIVPLPEGTFHVRGVKLGHIQPDPNYGIVVQPNKTTALDLTVGPACRLELNVVDSATSRPIPCKVTFENMINTPPMDFGPPDALAGRNAYYSATGRETIEATPGNYRIVVSRGPEYDTVEKIIRLQPGRLHQLDAALRRVVPTTGWISLDAGVRTRATHGCLVTPEDRVIAAAAEGVEYVFSGDENVVTDLSQAAKDTGMDAWLRTGLGVLVSATWKDPLGIFMAFPLKPGTSSAEIAPTNSAKDLFGQMREKFPGSLLTVCRPIFPDIGYYAIFGYDQKTHALPKEKGFSGAYDLLEVWEGKRAGALGMSLPVYWAEIFAGRRHGLLAGTHSSGLQDQETGSPRTYVYVGKDSPEEVAPEEIAAALRDGRVQITNGPFIDFKVQGQGPGAMVTPVDGYVEVQMTVHAANWVNTYSYQLDQNALFLLTNISPGVGITEPLRYPRGNDKKVQRVKCSTDCVLNGAVTGGRTMAPVISPFGHGDSGQVYPYAVTGPVYVDADGDGKCTPPKPTAYRGVEPAEEIED